MSSPPAARGSQEAGITQTSLRLLFHVCTGVTKSIPYFSNNNMTLLRGNFITILSTLPTLSPLNHQIVGARVGEKFSPLRLVLRLKVNRCLRFCEKRTDATSKLSERLSSGERANEHARIPIALPSIHPSIRIPCPSLRPSLDPQLSLPSPTGMRVKQYFPQRSD